MNPETIQKNHLNPTKTTTKTKSHPPKSTKTQPNPQKTQKHTKTYPKTQNPGLSFLLNQKKNYQLPKHHFAPSARPAGRPRKVPYEARAKRWSDDLGFQSSNPWNDFRGGGGGWVGLGGERFGGGNGRKSWENQEKTLRKHKKTIKKTCKTLRKTFFFLRMFSKCFFSPWWFWGFGFGEWFGGFEFAGVSVADGIIVGGRSLFGGFGSLKVVWKGWFRRLWEGFLGCFPFWSL